MIQKLREYQFLIYLILTCISTVFFVISANDLVFHNQALIQGSVTLTFLGNWIYWVITLSFIFALFFFYEVYTIFKDTRTFYKLIQSDSKQTFVKNLRKLEKISRKLGPAFARELKNAKEKWNVR